MTGSRQRFFRVMMLLAMLCGALQAHTLGADAPANDTRTLMRLEVSQWKCTSTDSCVTIRSVAISDAFALLDWRTAHSGGETLWHKAKGTWHRVASGGGAMGARDLERYGVPHSVALDLIRTRDL